MAAARKSLVKAEASNTHPFFANALRVAQNHFSEAISSQDLFLFASLTLRSKQRCSYFSFYSF